MQAFFSLLCTNKVLQKTKLANDHFMLFDCCCAITLSFAFLHIQFSLWHFCVWVAVVILKKNNTLDNWIQLEQLTIQCTYLLLTTKCKKKKSANKCRTEGDGASGDGKKKIDKNQSNSNAHSLYKGKGVWQTSIESNRKKGRKQKHKNSNELANPKQQSANRRERKKVHINY